jgi:hypothetical protein
MDPRQHEGLAETTAAVWRYVEAPLAFIAAWAIVIIAHRCAYAKTSTVVGLRHVASSVGC